MYSGLLDGGQTAELALATDRKAYVHLVRGAVAVNGQSLAAGDAALVDGETSLAFTDAVDAEVLVFDLHA
jgi:redox-sensitive bicupin YhaK (pirin superfamily)